MVPVLRFLYTNDLHGIGDFSHLAQAREEVDLWLDGGDAVGLPRDHALRDEPAIRRLHQSGCDLMVPGNHEFLALGADPFAAAPDLPIVCANLFRRSGTLLFPPSVILKSFAGDITVIGVTVPLLKASPRPLRRLAQLEAGFRAEFHLGDPIVAAREHVAIARTKGETVLVLSHLGQFGDDRLARLAKPDLILGAHTHEPALPTTLHGIPYARTGGGQRGERYDWDGTNLVT
ncbi:MAG: hypothetical protein C4320_08725 [Armatimonadota bacterium]